MGLALGRGEGGLDPTTLHLKRPLFGKEGWGLGGSTTGFECSVKVMGWSGEWGDG